MNLPLRPGTGDEAFLALIRGQVAGRVMDFRPDAMVVCAGFDAHAADPLAQLALSAAGFGQIGRELAKLAGDACGGRLVATLEGGYNLRALGESVVAFLRGLAA
jgi:acetoin utilization deacetylase AcuC-like enzyme